MICSRYNAATIVEVLQDHGLVSWYFFEQLLVELLVNALKAQSCADIYILYEDLHAVRMEMLN